MSGGRDGILSWAALSSLGLCVFLGARAQPPRSGGLWLQTYRQDTGDSDAESASTHASQRLRQTPELYISDYGFQNFNDDRLSVDYQVKKWAVQPYEEAFGYRKADVAARANDPAGLKAYFESRGFRELNENTVAVDMPQLVRKNTPFMHSVAATIGKTANERNYDSEEIVGAAASMAQTAIRYKVPPLFEGDRDTAGVLQPVSVLVRGYGDCDTKTGLIASILSNWPQSKMVGVAVPGHYLMGILRIPNKRDMYVEYGGLHYVLIESAGPAWLPPGTVSDHTVALLQNADGFRIDPFF